MRSIAPWKRRAQQLAKEKQAEIDNAAVLRGLEQHAEHRNARETQQKELIDQVTDTVVQELEVLASGEEPWGRCARALSGHPVAVNFINPGTGRIGVFYRSNGMGHIEMKRAMDLPEVFYSFLHEVAHAKLHWDTVKPLTEEQLDYRETLRYRDLGTVASPQEAQEHAKTPRELEADNLALEWFTAATAELEPVATLEERFQYLIDHFTGDKEF